MGNYIIYSFIWDYLIIWNYIILKLDICYKNYDKSQQILYISLYPKIII